MSDDLSDSQLPSEDVLSYALDLQESLAYIRAALGLSNDFPYYTRERGQEVLDAIDLEVRNSPDDLSREELREYLLERFTENFTYDKRVQIYTDSRARDAFMSLFENAAQLVAQVNSLHFKD